MKKLGKSTKVFTKYSKRAVFFISTIFSKLLKKSKNETILDKICANNSDTVKEKYIESILQLFTSDEKYTTSLLIHRLGQKFTRKQFSHYLYMYMKFLLSHYSCKFISIFIDSDEQNTSTCGDCNDTLFQSIKTEDDDIVTSLNSLIA